MSQFNAGKLVYNSVIKILAARVPLGHLMIRTCQPLNWTEPVKRVVQHDPVLLSLVNILTWIPHSHHVLNWYIKKIGKGNGKK